MSYIIIGLVVMSLLGSFMWVKPTKRDRMLAKLRMDAKKLGYQIQITKLTLPREHGKMEPREVSAVVYRLLRGKIDLAVHNNWKSWRVARCETNACEGLLKGWGWVLGERTLDQNELTLLNKVLENLPEDVIGMESTPIHASVFWKELEESHLTIITDQLNKLIEDKV